MLPLTSTTNILRSVDCLQIHNRIDFLGGPQEILITSFHIITYNILDIKEDLSFKH